MEFKKVIAFDSFSSGANTRLETCTGMESDKKAHDVLLEWYEGFINAIDEAELPAKFCLFSASMGCLPMGMYAAKHRNRVERLFLSSPCGT